MILLLCAGKEGEFALVNVSLFFIIYMAGVLVYEGLRGWFSGVPQEWGWVNGRTKTRSRFCRRRLRREGDGPFLTFPFPGDLCGSESRFPLLALRPRPPLTPRLSRCVGSSYKLYLSSDIVAELLGLSRLDLHNTGLIRVLREIYVLIKATSG